MNPLMLMALMGGTQLLQSQQQGQNRASDLRLLAKQTEMSPWSGLTPSQQVGARPNALAMVGQGAMAGYQTGSNIEQSKLQNELMQEMIRNEQMKSMNSTWSGLGAPVIPAAESFKMPEM